MNIYLFWSQLFLNWLCVNPCIILVIVDIISTRYNLCFRRINCCLSLFVCLMVAVIVCCEKVLENAHIKFVNFNFLNLNVWLELECLYFIIIFQSLYYHFRIKMATRNLRFYFSYVFSEITKPSCKLGKAVLVVVKPVDFALLFG